MPTPLPILIPFERVAEFCDRSGIRRLSLFGSVLRDDFGPESDLDILVEFQPGTRIGLLGLHGLQEELGEIFGRRVDLNTPGFLSRYFREEVLREARPIHVAA